MITLSTLDILWQVLSLKDLKLKDWMHCIVQYFIPTCICSSALTIQKLSDLLTSALFDDSNMLIFFVLCSFLRSLQGASVPQQHDALGSVATGDHLTFMGRESPPVPDHEGRQLRTVYSIVQSCLLTIFACVWTSAHPNINGPRDSGWVCLKRRAVIMLCTVLAPELVLFWALRQYAGAKKLVQEYNKALAKPGMWPLPLFWSSMSEFQG